MNLTPAQIDQYDRTPDGPLHAAQITLDGTFGPYDAWTEAGYWNGWAMPWFTLEQARDIIRICAKGDGRAAYYDEATDAAVFLIADGDPDDPECWEGYRGHDVVCDDGVTRHLYGVGAGAWIWDDEGAPGEGE